MSDAITRAMAALIQADREWLALLMGHPNLKVKWDEMQRETRDA